jgi:hypothetical protein
MCDIVGPKGNLMIRASALFLVLSASFAFGVMGCAANTGDVDEGTASKLSSEKLLEAKLYDDPDAAQQDFCDVHTFLSLEKSAGKIVAKLENRVTGACEIHVERDPRSFEVTTATDCGSTVYEGQAGGDKVRIQDHRQRLCHDLRPAILEIEETRRGKSYSLYGAPLGAAQGENTKAPVSQVLDVKLYGDPPKGNVDSFCDHYTKVVIGQEGDRLVANVKEELSAKATCEIAVLPNERTYPVTKSAACGSTIYEGQNGDDSLRVQDNRTRYCEDLRPAIVEAQETYRGHTTELFGDL